MRKLHPATVAIRAAHKAFQSRAESVGPCFATDLRHELRIPSAQIRGCASEMEEFHVWDGSTLTLARSVEYLLELYERAAFRAALNEAHRAGSDEQIRALEDEMLTRGWL